MAPILSLVVTPVNIGLASGPSFSGEESTFTDDDRSPLAFESDLESDTIVSSNAASGMETKVKN